MDRVEQSRGSNGTENASRFLMAALGLVACGFAALWQGNKLFAPEMYSRSGVAEIADALAEQTNYAVFDLNINIRELRDEHLRRMTVTPDVMVLGASHWQEAHDWLIQHKTAYNAHVHRDYYEDMLGMVELLERHNRMPKQLIIAIRDNLFTPVAARKDHLWLPGVPYYEAMAKRLDIPAHAYLTTAPYKRWRELISLPMFHANASRWANATFRPHRTFEAEHSNLDVLLPGGSIIWSHEHQATFTAKRTREMSDDFARQRRDDPPLIDPIGVAHIDKLLGYLKNRGVEVYLAHPPFNPDYYRQVMKGRYGDGLRRVEQLTQDFADKYGWEVIGSFNPDKVGCTAKMFIDAEHSSPECLSKLFRQYTALDKRKSLPDPAGPALAGATSSVEPVVQHSIAVAVAQPDAVLAPVAATEPDVAVDSGRPAAGAISIKPKILPGRTAIEVPVEKPTEVSSVVPAAARATNPLKTAAGAGLRTVRYPIAITTRVVKTAAATCTPYVWPGDWAYPERLSNVCGYRKFKPRGR